jgi:hypothetical protein
MGLPELALVVEGFSGDRAITIALALATADHYCPVIILQGML